MAPNSAYWVNSSAVSPTSEDLVEDFVQSIELAGAAGECAAVTQEVRRMVAHLLEFGHRR